MRISVCTIESTTRLVFGLRFQTSLVVSRPKCPGTRGIGMMDYVKAPLRTIKPHLVHITLSWLNTSKDMWRFVGNQKKIRSLINNFITSLNTHCTRHTICAPPATVFSLQNAILVFEPKQVSATCMPPSHFWPRRPLVVDLFQF